MKIFDILDADRKDPAGILMYYEKSGTFIIELQDHLDEWTAPLLFTGLVRHRVFTVPRDISLMWVRERLIPPSRQNIGMILSNHKLESYDEIKMLEITRGICSQDSLYIKGRDSLPEYVLRRQEKNLLDCVVCSECRLICFFADDTIRVIDLKDIKENEGVDKVLSNEKLYQTGMISPGGYAVTFNDSIDIPAYILHRAGTELPVKRQDLMAFIQRNILDTTESGRLMGCTRQNISYLVKKNRLQPVKEEIKGNLYLKGELLKNTW